MLCNTTSPPRKFQGILISDNFYYLSTKTGSLKLMNFEQIDNTENKTTDMLTDGFRALNHEELDSPVFQKLEDELEKAGYELADNNAVSGVLHDNSLFCRSENFSKVIDLTIKNAPIELNNDNGGANMCTMSSTAGYRTAMTEGFSGKDVNHAVKVVVSFLGEHLTSHNTIPTNDELWRLKPETASVSLSGSGHITHDDIKMISFRFPISFYPEHLLSETEKSQLEESEIKFIVRHYIPKKTTH